MVQRHLHEACGTESARRGGSPRPAIPPRASWPGVPALRSAHEHLHEVVMHTVVEIALKRPGELRVFDVARVDGGVVGVQARPGSFISITSSMPPWFSGRMSWRSAGRTGSSEGRPARSPDAAAPAESRGCARARPPVAQPGQTGPRGVRRHHLLQLKGHRSGVLPGSRLSYGARNAVCAPGTYTPGSERDALSWTAGSPSCPRKPPGPAAGVPDSLL